MSNPYDCSECHNEGYDHSVNCSRNPRNAQCEARETVQLGPMSATDLRCTLPRWAHKHEHKVSRSFGIVTMTAVWSGDFYEEK